MSLRFAASALLFATLVASGNAFAAEQIVDCSATFERSPCVAESFGQNSDPQELARKGFDLLRITARFGLYGHDLAFEMVKPQEGGPWLLVRDPEGIGQGQKVQLTQATYDALEQEWEDFRPALSDPETAATKAKEKGWPPCTDGADLQVDTVKAGKALQTVIDMCLVTKANKFVEDMRKRAYALLPSCAGTDIEPMPFCLRLSGNEILAADVAVILDRVEHSSDCRDIELSESVQLNKDAITLSGRKSVGSWISENCRLARDTVLYDIRGEEDAVVVSGKVVAVIQEKAADGSSHDHFEAAPFSQVWQKTNSRGFAIVSWKIGKFVEVNWLL